VLKKIVQVPETLLDAGDSLANALLKKYKNVRMRTSISTMRPLTC